MRIPQVTERIGAENVARASARAARAVFAQVGRLVLAADQLRRRVGGPAAAAPAGLGGPGTPGRPRPPEPPRFRPLDQTGNVRVLTPEELGDDPPVSLAEPGPAARPGGAAPAGAAGPGLPVPGYDGLSLPSLRARLRNLDGGQLQVLIDYERAHAGRPDVLAMFGRRLEKLAGR